MATPDNVHIFVPNSKIWGSDIWNYSRYPLRRQDINVGISYGDDINKAFSILNDILSAETRLIRGEAGKEPQVMVDKMADFSVDIIIRFWSTREDYWDLKWSLTKQVKEALDAGGITIPFPTRTLEIKNAAT